MGQHSPPLRLSLAGRWRILSALCALTGHFTSGCGGVLDEGQGSSGAGTVSIADGSGSSTTYAHMLSWTAGLATESSAGTGVGSWSGEATSSASSISSAGDTASAGVTENSTEGQSATTGDDESASDGGTESEGVSTTSEVGDDGALDSGGETVGTDTTSEVTTDASDDESTADSLDDTMAEADASGDSSTETGAESSGGESDADDGTTDTLTEDESGGDSSSDAETDTDTSSTGDDSCPYDPDCGTVSPGMVCIPGGEFDNSFMGDGTDIHCVRKFLIDREEVTVDAYQSCVDAGECSPSNDDDDRQCNTRHPDRGHHPINCITSKQATEYCTFVGKRLPFSMEWARAAQGEARKLYPWGRDYPDCDTAVFWHPDFSQPGCGTGATFPVGSKSPAGDSVYGVRDTAGNVAEWLYKATNSGRDRHRGGAFDDKGGGLQSPSVTYPAVNGGSDPGIGARCVQEL